jgi:pre-mRNA-splicing helicase BRR2
LSQDPDKQKEIGELFGEELESDRFAHLVAIGKMITDFNPSAELDAIPGDALDEEIGVAVEFEGEDEEEGDSEVDEIVV